MSTSQGIHTASALLSTGDALLEFKDTVVARNVAARFVEAADPKKRLLMKVYNRMPIGNKHLQGGKHMIMFSGSSAKAYGVDNYTTVTLEDLSQEELEKAAKAVGA